MNILLIHPYINSSVPTLYLTEPMGLVCLATYLEKKSKGNRNINILDLYALGHNKTRKIGDYYNIGISDPKTILNMINRYNPDIIGITCSFTTYTKAVFELTNLIKENFPKALLVLGGAHVTIDAENTLSKYCKADIVVRGEGEITFEEIVQKMESGKNLFDTIGITYRYRGNIISNPKRELIPNINGLPIPDRKFIKQDVYLKINKEMYFLSKSDNVASIITSRGCPYNCVFCSTKVVWERKFRPRSAELVVKEIERSVKQYHANEILIGDDQFYLDKERVLKICDLLIQKKMNITFNVTSGSSIWLLDKGLLKKLKKAGLYRITFPIESGNTKTLKYVRKPIDLVTTKEMIRLANSLGIWTYGNFIIGFPYETYEDIQETINYAKRSGLDYVTFFIAKPYAGSEMYETFKKEGLLPDGELKPTTMGEADIDTMYLKAAELQKIRNNAQNYYTFLYISRFFNPVFFINNIFPKIKSVDGLRYFLRSIKSQIRYVFKNILIYANKFIGV